MHQGVGIEQKQETRPNLKPENITFKKKLRTENQSGVLKKKTKVDLKLKPKINYRHKM